MKTAAKNLALILAITTLLGAIIWMYIADVDSPTQEQMHVETLR